MPKFLCERTCYIPGAHMPLTSLHDRGNVYDIDDLDDDFKHLFTSMEDAELTLDFDSASADQLMASKWKAKKLVAYVSENYGVEIKLNEDSTKTDLVDRLIYARENYRNEPPGH